MIKTAVEEKCGTTIHLRQVCKLLHKELGLGYRKILKADIQANSERCLVLR